MKKLLLLGAGKSATVLIEYLLHQCELESWLLIVADINRELAAAKTGNSAFGKATVLDIWNEAERACAIKEADIVISLLPPALHYLVARDCLLFKKNLLTASYIDAAIKELKNEIEENGSLFLCEMGLDPGIDHMSARKLIDNINKKGGVITSFLSHCGGLVAPESDDNPWHYKISWNPKNVVVAGKSGAVYKEDGVIKTIPYEVIFSADRLITIPQYGTLCWYPNRDSLPYMDAYNLHDCRTFIRTTLRHPDFVQGWKYIIDLKLTDEEKVYETNGKKIKDIFEEHLQKHTITTGQTNSLIKEQVQYLGIQDDLSPVNQGTCSAADVLQLVLEKKLSLQPHDKDLVVMLHEIEYIREGFTYKVQSRLLVTGKDAARTAMAATVGLPLGIAAVLILNGKIQLIGLHIPTKPEIYNPVLKELEKQGIYFEEKEEIL